MTMITTHNLEKEEEEEEGTYERTTHVHHCHSGPVVGHFLFSSRSSSSLLWLAIELGKEQIESETRARGSKGIHLLSSSSSTASSSAPPSNPQKLRDPPEQDQMSDIAFQQTIRIFCCSLSASSSRGSHLISPTSASSSPSLFQWPRTHWFIISVN